MTELSLRRKVHAFNGASIGKGHLAQGKAVINGHKPVNGKPVVFTARKGDLARKVSGNGEVHGEPKLGKVGTRNVVKP